MPRRDAQHSVVQPHPLLLPPAALLRLRRGHGHGGSPAADAAAPRHALLPLARNDRHRPFVVAAVDAESETVAFMVAGGLTGLLPLFHVHSLVVLGLVTGCWALLFPRPAWLGFFVVTLVLAVPRLLMAVPGDPGAPAEHQYPRWLIGWMSGTD